MTTQAKSKPDVDANDLIGRLRLFDRIAVAFSGGVDSSVVAAAARVAIGDNAIAVTACSPSLASSQLAIATKVAAEIGIEHRIIQTGEIDRPEYRRNDGRRCFFCKQTLYDTMQSMVQQHPGLQIVSGTNADDLGDYRPGLHAAGIAGVVAPMAELGWTKADVRKVAASFGLSNHDLPAAPCLASRVAYGVEVTPKRLRRIELAEHWLQQRGFATVRVRLHPGELARIEVPAGDVAACVALNQDGSLSAAFRSFGFVFVTIDMEGFRSGNLNELLVNIDAPVHANASRPIVSPKSSS